MLVKAELHLQLNRHIFQERPSTPQKTRFSLDPSSNRLVGLGDIRLHFSPSRLSGPVKNHWLYSVSITFTSSSGSLLKAQIIRNNRHQASLFPFKTSLNREQNFLLLFNAAIVGHGHINPPVPFTPLNLPSNFIHLPFLDTYFKFFSCTSLTLKSSSWPTSPSRLNIPFITVLHSYHQSSNYTVSTMASRRTPRAVSVSRGATPSEAGDSWNGGRTDGRLRPRQPSLEATAPSPTKVNRTAATRAIVSKRTLNLSAIGGSVSQSIAESDAGSIDPITGNRSRNARNSQLQEESSHQRVQAWRAHSNSGAASPDRFLSAVQEESEEPFSGRSFGPRHEHGMGQTGSRNKSFSEDHEDGIARSVNRQHAGEPAFQERDSVQDRSRNSFSTHTSTPAGLDRARNGHKNTIRSILALLVLLVFGWLCGQALWENAKHHLASPTVLPDGSTPPTVTVTSHLHAHKTTTVTQIIKETSVVAPRPFILERRNFFNMEIGAKIDPSLTSITRAPMNVLYSILAPLSGKWFPGPIVNQADAALKHWTETGQSWCAASSDLGQGQLQLGISLPFTVRPLAVTLEHQLEHLSFDPFNSARHVELWVEAHEDSTGANANNDCGPTPEGMDEFWFCVAKMEFSRFNGEEKSQRIEFRNEHMFTNHFAFRVLDNWGSDHTCLYRIQMHGELKRKMDSGAGA